MYPGMPAEEYARQYKQVSNLKPLLAVLGESSLGAESNLGIKDYEEWQTMCEVTEELIAANIPVYPSIGRAARAARKLVDYYQKRK